MTRAEWVRPIPNDLRAIFVRIALAVITALNRVAPKTNRILVHGFPDGEDGTLAVIEELVTRGHQPLVLLNSDRDRGPYRTRAAREVRSVPKRSLRALLYFITSRYVIVTHGIYGNRRPPVGQVVVNLWHGEPAGKPVGKYDGGANLQCTIAPVLSTVGQAYRCAEFGLHPRQVPILGAPRNDRLLRTDPAAARRVILDGLSPRALFLWLPTYRTAVRGARARVDVERRHAGVPFDLACVQELDDWLHEHDAVMMIKPHPLEAIELTGTFKAIRVLSQQELGERGLTLYNLLAITDCLVTDVSSVWIDFLLTDRPIVIAFPDIEEYRRVRGINLEPYEEWVPGPLVKSVEELIAEAGKVVAGADTGVDERRRATRRCHRFLDDQSTRRLLDHAGLHDVGGRT